MNRRTLTPLEANERQTLLEMYRYHQKSRLRERAHIALLSSAGFYIKQIATIICRDELTVSTWLDAFEKHGFLGLYDEPIPGRPARLNAEQQQQMDTWLSQSPRKAGYHQSHWTLKLLRHALFLCHRIRLRKSRLWEMVRSLGFVRLRPRHRSSVPTDQQIAWALQSIEKWLQKAQTRHVRLFYLDETVAMVWSTLCACWAKKGTPPQIPMADDHGRVAVIAAANPITRQVHYRIVPTVNQAGIVAFLKQIRRRYPNEPLVFILDNAKPPIAASVKQFAALDGKITLESLPRYTSLHCNPIERLFKWFRRVVTHNEYFENLLKLKQAIQAFFRLVANLPKRIMTLLNLKTLQKLNSLPESL